MTPVGFRVSCPPWTVAPPVGCPRCQAPRVWRREPRDPGLRLGRSSWSAPVMGRQRNREQMNFKSMLFPAKTSFIQIWNLTDGLVLFHLITVDYHLITFDYHLIYLTFDYHFMYPLPHSHTPGMYAGGGGGGCSTPPPPLDLKNIFGIFFFFLGGGNPPLLWIRRPFFPSCFFACQRGWWCTMDTPTPYASDTHNKSIQTGLSSINMVMLHEETFTKNAWMVIYIFL